MIPSRAARAPIPTEGQNMSDTLEKELQHVLNCHSAENASNTPDFILAQYLLGCLAAWNQGVQQRETWYGRDARPASTAIPTGPLPGRPLPR